MGWSDSDRYSAHVQASVERADEIDARRKQQRYVITGVYSAFVEQQVAYPFGLLVQLRA